MSAHVIEKVQQKDGLWHAWCSCRASSDIVPQEWRVVDWIDRHERLVEQARAHLKKQPSLNTLHDYYVEMSQNTAVPEKDREQWKGLAEGLRTRLRSTEPEMDDLFDVKPFTRQPNRKGSQ